MECKECSSGRFAGQPARPDQEDAAVLSQKKRIGKFSSGAEIGRYNGRAAGSGSAIQLGKPSEFPAGKGSWPKINLGLELKLGQHLLDYFQ